MSELHRTEDALRVTQPCARGCVQARRHVTDCLDRDACRGCFPRPAEHGVLCYGCHRRLVNLIQHAPGQHAMLLATAAKSGEQALTQETIAKIGDGMRLSSDAPFQGPYARKTVLSSEATEPVRVAALAAAQDLSAALSELVERVVDDYGSRGPLRLLSAADRDDPRRKSWHAGEWSEAEGRYVGPSRFDEVKVYRDDKGVMAGQYLWIDPPQKFDAESAAPWLLAQIERVEYCESAGDDLEALSEVMSQAHSLAPWREQVSRVHAIPCPECHASRLVIFGGDEDVTCLRCKATMSPARYAIWVRMLTEANQEVKA